MKVLVFIVLMLGTSLAKPTAEEQVVQLLKKILKQKEEPSTDDELAPYNGPATTLFNELGEAPYDIFDGEQPDLATTLTANDVNKVVKEDFAKVVGQIETFTAQVLDIATEIASGDLSNMNAKDVLDMFRKKNEEIEEDEDVDIAQFFTDMYLAGLRGAIAGTNDGEEACTADKSQSDYAACVMNKVTLFFHASGRMTEIIKMELSDVVEDCGKPGGSTKRNIDAASAVNKVHDFVVCLRGNMDTIRDHAKLASDNANVNLLPKLVIANSFAEQYFGRVWWFYKQMGEFEDKLGGGDGKGGKGRKGGKGGKGDKKMMKSHIYLQKSMFDY